MLTGRCLCGAVCYEARENPVYAFHCFCATCRRESGAGHLTIASFREYAVTISGPLKMIAPPRAEGADPIPRYFCPSCGTTMFAKPTGDHGLKYWGQTPFLYGDIMDRLEKLPAPILHV